jgi:hypothetical protein
MNVVLDRGNLVEKIGFIYPCGSFRLQSHLNHILNNCWKISPVHSGYAPFTPHYKLFFILSEAPLLVVSCPTVE